VARSKRMPDKDSTPLRKSKATSDPTPIQEAYLAAFLASCVIGYTGVYAVRYTNSGAIKLKLYIDGDSYEDILETNEDWAILFDDYAVQAGVKATYQAIVGAFHGGLPVLAAQAPERVPPTDDTTPARSKPLRAS